MSPTELAARVGETLRSRDLALVTAESCTGGWLAAAVTAIPGSSAWFERGFVTYSNASKQELLGVAAETLSSHGAVSEAVVREMAQGAVARSPAQVSVAVSGVAGPEGGTPAKPVGTVCLAWAVAGGVTRSRRVRYEGDREAVRRQAVEAALQGILEVVAGGAT